MTGAACTRRAFVGALGAGAAGLLVGAPSAAGAQGAAADLEILNHALVLEHLQAALYTRAAGQRALGPLVARMTEAMGGVERAHVAALTEALGDAALPPPLFDVTRATTGERAFIRHAAALEDLAAATYLHQLPRLASPELRALLAAIHTVDAGHSAWIRLLAGVAPATEGIDRPVAEPEATRLLLGSGMVIPRPGTAPDSPWVREQAREGFLAAFPLGRRPAADPVAAATPQRPRALPPPQPAPGGHRWGLWVATTAGLSALVLGGRGVRARDRSVERVTVVGPDEGPAVSQRARTPRGVAGDPAAAQNPGVPRPAPHRTSR